MRHCGSSLSWGGRSSVPPDSSFQFSNFDLIRKSVCPLELLWMHLYGQRCNSIVWQRERGKPNRGKNARKNFNGALSRYSVFLCRFFFFCSKMATAPANELHASLFFFKFHLELRDRCRSISQLSMQSFSHEFGLWELIKKAANEKTMLPSCGHEQYLVGKNAWKQDGACAHYVMVSTFQWKPFWLATQRDQQNVNSVE